MEFVPYDKISKSDWDDFCVESNEAWFWHTSKWLSYTLAYSEGIGAINSSFAVYDSKKIIAIIPLIFEGNMESREIAFGRVPGPLPALLNGLSGKDKNSLRKDIFAHIDDLAVKGGVLRSRMRSNPLAQASVGNSEGNYSIRYGYIDTSIHTQIIDLKSPLAMILKGFSNGHSSDIKRGLKDIEVIIFDEKNITDYVFNKYVALKIKLSGESVRAKKTFDLMSDWIKVGQGILVAARIKGEDEFAGFVYICIYKNSAYYASSGIDSGAKPLPFTHVIQASAINYLKSRGLKNYEIGWQVFTKGLNDFSSPKEIAIAKFKRGFGGRMVSLYMGEKYYNKEYFLKVFKERVGKVAISI